MLQPSEPGSISMPAIGVVGLGQMAKALIKPLLQCGVLQPSKLLAIVSTTSSCQHSLKTLPKGMTVYTADDPVAVEVWQTPMQLLAVKPQQLAQVAASCPSKSLIAQEEQPLLVSILAGVCLRQLQDYFPSHACVRVVPSITLLAGAGLTGIAWGDNIHNTHQSWALQLFQAVSEVLELPENQLDAFLALTSSGPAYVALVAEAMADGAVAAGLPRQLALYLAHRTLAGTATLLQLHELHPAQLKDMVTSPAGTTAAALRHLERAGLRSALIEAVIAAAIRSKELSIE